MCAPSAFFNILINKSFAVIKNHKIIAKYFAYDKNSSIFVLAKWAMPTILINLTNLTRVVICRETNYHHSFFGGGARVIELKGY